MNKAKRKWLWSGGVGATLVGLGVSASIESAFLKHQGAELWYWMLLGTLSLSVLISGIILLIKAGHMENSLKNRLK